MILTAGFTIALCLTFSVCAGKVQVDEQQATFQRNDQGLAWPLPNPYDAGVQLFHASHCFDLIQDELDDDARIHREHCVDFLRRVVKYLEAHPDFRVPELICQASDPKREATTPFQVLRGMQAEPWGGGGIWVRGIDANSTQHATYTALGGENFARLVVSNYKSPQSLNPTEKAYLGQWNSERSITMSAVGLYCRVNGELVLVKKALDQAAELISKN